MRPAWGQFMAAAAAIAGLSGCAWFGSNPLPVDAVVAPWPGNAESAVALAFDDGCESQTVNVISLLRTCDIPATFYGIPDAPWVRSRSEFWEKTLPETPQAYPGNHTYSHYGASDVEQAHDEIMRADRRIRELWNLNDKVLISYAPPQGVEWPLGGDSEFDWCAGRSILRRSDDSIITAGRPGASSAIEVLAALDRSRGGARTVRFHGIGGDWFSFEPAELEKLLQALAGRRDRLFIAPQVDVDKYVVLRDAVRIASAEEVGDGEIEIKLEWSRSLDPEQYDVPLTLLIKLPESWRAAEARIDGDPAAPVELRGRTALCRVPGGRNTVRLLRR